MRLKLCRYCRQEARLMHFGHPQYVYRSDWGPVWACIGCNAWVGCHDGTTEPLGGLANAELRKWKRAAHAAFDPLWKKKIAREGCSKGVARRAGYKWLSEALGIPLEKTHIGFMCLEECQKVVEICSKFGGKK